MMYRECHFLINSTMTVVMLSVPMPADCKRSYAIILSNICSIHNDINSKFLFLSFFSRIDSFSKLTHCSLVRQSQMPSQASTMN